MKKVKTNIELKTEVLGIVDQLFNELDLLDRESDKISLSIVESLSGAYAEMNCGNHFAFEDILIPYLKKMDENKRLLVVKQLLTFGYVDIYKVRVYMRLFSYLNKTKNEPTFPYVSDIPITSE